MFLYSTLNRIPRGSHYLVRAGLIVRDILTQSTLCNGDTRSSCTCNILFSGASWCVFAIPLYLLLFIVANGTLSKPMRARIPFFGNGKGKEDSGKEGGGGKKAISEVNNSVLGLGRGGGVFPDDSYRRTIPLHYACLKVRRRRRPPLSKNSPNLQLADLEHFVIWKLSFIHLCRVERKGTEEGICLGTRRDPRTKWKQIPPSPSTELREHRMEILVVTMPLINTRLVIGFLRLRVICSFSSADSFLEILGSHPPSLSFSSTIFPPARPLIAYPRR